MEEINIKDFFSYLSHYIFAYIFLVALAVGGVAIYDLNYKKPIYQAKATVVISSADSGEGESTTTLNDVNLSQKLATTYSEIAKSELVLNQVIENLSLRSDASSLGKNVAIKPVDNTSILSITVKNQDAKTSAVIANEIAKVFSQEIASIFKIENLKQLSAATTPDAPANNTLMRDIVLAGVISILAVTGFAFLKFYLDDSVKHSDDIEKTVGLATVGCISRSEIKAKNPTGELVVDKSPKAIVSENIKSLRTNLQFASVDEDLKSILITSVNAGEGKSFVSSNLAISFAQAYKKVLLVDCDLRKGRLHKLFGVANTSGYSNLLTSDLRSINKYIHPTRIENLSIITCGAYPPNPSELLASKKNKRLIGLLCGYFDIVIFDGAPVGGLADSVILSSLVDETIVVVRDGGTSRNDLIATKESLSKVGAKVAGVVFNMANRKSSKYYNSYYYGDPTK